MGRPSHITLALACLGVALAAATAVPVAEYDTGVLRYLAEADASGDKSSGSQGTGGDGSMNKPRQYKLDVTVGNGAPDCVNRKVILVNGEFEPRLVFAQGDWVEVSICSTALLSQK